MAILARVRRLLRPDPPVEIDISHHAQPEVLPDDVLGTPGMHAGTESGNPAMELLDRIESGLKEGRETQERAARALEVLPGSLEHLATVATRQEDLLLAVRELGQSQRQRAESEGAVLDRLSDMVDRESALLALVQRQLDANHEIVQHTAGRLEELSAAVTEGVRTNRVTAEAMEAMVGEMQAREKRSEDRASAMQGWIVTCVVACIAATAASLALAWAVLGQTG